MDTFAGAEGNALFVGTSLSAYSQTTPVLCNIDNANAFGFMVIANIIFASIDRTMKMNTNEMLVQSPLLVMVVMACTSSDRVTEMSSSDQNIPKGTIAICEKCASLEVAQSETQTNLIGPKVAAIRKPTKATLRPRM